MEKILKGACVIGQSGGPTAVINASAYGAIRAALDNENITKVYGAANGIVGVINDKLYDLTLEDDYELMLLTNTPSSELGSCRYKIANFTDDDSDFQKILDTFKKHDVRYFFYIGGNDSMDTCNKMSAFMAQSGYDCRVMGVPKTIDNDLFGTDHCPGFGSAAKYIATTCMEVSKDAGVYSTGMITVIEIMGRNAGWLAGSAAIAAKYGAGPDLVYLPEVAFDIEKFFEDVTRIYSEKGNVFIAMSEGIADKDGKLISSLFSDMSSATDAFGHAQLGGLAVSIAEEAKRRTGAKVRGIELSLLQRCGAHLASKNDVDEAVMAGRIAVESAANGESGFMVAFERVMENGEYKCATKLMPLNSVANFEKKVPLEWINEAGNGVTDEFIDYVLPLIQGTPERYYEDSLPRYAKLKKIIAE